MERQLQVQITLAAATNTPLQFLSGELTKDVVVSLTSDDIDEFDETFNVVLTLPTTTTNAEFVGGSSVRTLTGVGTIVDDDRSTYCNNGEYEFC